MKQSAKTLRTITRARDQGISVVLITHNAHHAYPVGDTFTLLDRGRSMGSFHKTEISRDDLVGNLLRAARANHARNVAGLGRPADRGSGESPPRP